ncbi:hypothetical protein JOC73_002928 [Alkaliphilus hydrothermalis]|uniref:Uncharacterized protein n=1 Tax=Alkaliphilus hydrothermalis TaxID=1482730 RepID=A0ABS2NTW3_9FIRM|nr:hypothetical protein [Alkaliphilus hydrothermalis]
MDPLAFASGVEKFASSRGVSLNRVTSNAAFTLENTTSYIVNGLANDSPVATLNLNGFWDEHGWHWMTITRYYRDWNDNRFVNVSSWGKIYNINYQILFDAMKNFDGGLMYFQ